MQGKQPTTLARLEAISERREEDMDVMSFKLSRGVPSNYHWDFNKQRFVKNGTVLDVAPRKKP